MVKKGKLKPGAVYEVQWRDHFQVDSKSNQAATLHDPVILTSYGKYVGYNKFYDIFSYNYENSISENNDHMFILKNQIVSIKELK